MLLTSMGAQNLLIKSATLVNEGKIYEADVKIQDKRIAQIGRDLSAENCKVIEAAGKYLLPGVIDDQVHFREPGLTHKAELYTEAKAAVAGGITSYMEMPNTSPPTLNQELLEWKYKRAAEISLANYSFFMGASNDNLEEVLKTSPTEVCGIKIFMGSSTGNMLVDNEKVLERIFAETPMLIATHCEDEATVRHQLEIYKEKYGAEIPISAHPLIRSAEACWLSSSKAVALAQKHNTRLHILHISTAKELNLFRNDLPLSEKRITSEACVHHLWFTDADYAEKGTLIKWNPAVKTAADREAIRTAVLDNRIDIVATDHAPHTWEEKQGNYLQAPSGAPLVQHSLLAMLELSQQGVFSLEKVVEKMSHHPAICFQLAERGFLREGHYADLVLVDLNKQTKVSRQNLHYKCGWSPLEGTTFRAQIEKTFVNGHLVYDNGNFDESQKGMRLRFARA